VFFVVLGMCHVAVCLFTLGLDLYTQTLFLILYLFLVPCLMVDKFFEVMKFIAVVNLFQCFDFAAIMSV
jgi:hypothetical protein